MPADLLVFPPSSSGSTSEMSTYTLTINIEHTYSQKLRSNGFKLCFAKCINGAYSVVWDAVEYVFKFSVISVILIATFPVSRLGKM